MDIFTKNRATNWMIVLLVILNVSSLTTIWFLQLRQSPLPQDNRPDNVRHFLEQELRLTEEQAQQFEELRKQHFVETKAIHEEASQLKKTIMDELFASPPDTAKVESLAEQIGSKQTELEQLRFYHFLNLKSLCEPEQVEKFQALIHEIFQPPGPPEADRPPGSPQGQGILPGEPQHPAPPPQEAIDACKGKNQGNTCQIKAPQGTVTGTCMRIENQLACIPPGENRPPGPDRSR